MSWAAESLYLISLKNGSVMEVEAGEVKDNIREY